jgi:hypothetical protein
MPRRIVFEVPVEIPTSRGWKPFRDLLGAAWGLLREESVGPMESVGIGFTWWSGAREGSGASALPRPWSLIRNGLVERLAVDPKAHVFMLRSEVVHCRRDERPRLLVVLER